MYSRLVSRGTKAARPAAAIARAFIALLIAAFMPLSQTAFASQEDENLVDPTQRADNSFIRDTTIEQLSDEASLYDGKIVQVMGEVIGDKIKTDEEGTCWITLTVTDSEDKTSISVQISEEQASQIDRYGKYGVTGTIFQVNGTFHQSCPEHDALPDIHAVSSEALSQGVDNHDTFDLNDYVPGLITLCIGLLLIAAFHFARERMR